MKKLLLFLVLAAAAACAPAPVGPRDGIVIDSVLVCHPVPVPGNPDIARCQ